MLGLSRALGFVMNEGGTVEKARVCGATVGQSSPLQEKEGVAGPPTVPEGLSSWT